MPFTLIKSGKNKGKYRSPSGRIFTKKQVRRYYARGGSFDAKSLFDAEPRMPRRDPTLTAGVRRSLRAETNFRIRRLETMVKDVLLKMGSFDVMSPQFPMLGLQTGRLKLFQHWADAVLQQVLLQDNGQWIHPHLGKAYNLGKDRGARFTGGEIPPTLQNAYTLILAASIMELQGMVEAISQRMVRDMAAALLANRTSQQQASAIVQGIRVVSKQRVQPWVNSSVVRAHANGTLDAFETAGVDQVGVFAEEHRGTPKGVGGRSAKKSRLLNVNRDSVELSTGSENEENDSLYEEIHRLSETADKSSTSQYLHTSTSNGGLVSNSLQDAPQRRARSARTQQRRERAERELEAAFPGLVKVQTAGDELVCAVCEDIEEGGPYGLDQARSLIPAHPNCRCAFVPYGFDPEQSRARSGRWDAQAEA